MATRVLRGDGVTFLTIFVVLLLVIPSRYVAAPLGAAGTPAQVVGMAMAMWWVGHRLARPFPTAAVSQPVRRAMLVFGAAVLASYIAATVRPIEVVELRAADRGLLTLCAWLGVILVASDEIPSRLRLDTLLRLLILIGGGMAALGVVQFQTGMSFTEYLQPPGLTESSDLSSVAARDGFVRPAGTALHPIEFGVVLSMLLPLALHYALEAGRAGRFRRWFPVVSIGLAIPISVSRSAIVCTAVVLVILLPTWSREARRVAYLGCLGLAAVVYVMVPGMLGTLTRLFTGISQDSSALSRTDSYDLAEHFIARAPVFGRGFATFLPAYRILDNQYLGTLIEMGVVGLLSLLGLFITALWTANRVRRIAREPATRQLSQALIASIAAGGFGFALFDAFSFPMAAGLTFLLMGVTGSLRRLELARSADAAALSSTPRGLDGASHPIIPLPR